MRLFIFIIFYLLICNCTFSLIVTEIFYKGNRWISSDERFIELYNDSGTVFPLDRLTIQVPGGLQKPTNIMISKGKFEGIESWVQTNTVSLNPGQYAIITTEQLNQYNHLIPFYSNTILLKPRNQAFTQWTWAGRLQSIKLLTNQIVIWNCENYRFPDDQDIPEGSSLSLYRGNQYEISGLNPGQNRGWIEVSEPIIKANQSYYLTLFDPERVDSTFTSVIRTLKGEEKIVVWNKLSPEKYQTELIINGMLHGADLYLD